MDQLNHLRDVAQRELDRAQAIEAALRMGLKLVESEGLSINGCVCHYCNFIREARKALGLPERGWYGLHHVTFPTAGAAYGSPPLYPPFPKPEDY